MIEEVVYLPDGSFSGKNIYKYNGYLIEKKECFSNDSNIIKETYKYDDKRNMIEEVHNDTDGSLLYKNTYKYDTHGNKIEEVDYDNLNEPTLKSEYIFSK